MTKKCSHCKEYKELAEFHKNKSKKDGHQHACKECRKIYIRKNYLENKQAYIDRSEKTKIKNRELVWNIKLNSKCIKCGEDHPSVLDFHHRNKEEKKFTISQSYMNHGKLKILEEIKKCDVLCANCHRKLHYKEKGIKNVNV